MMQCRFAGGTDGPDSGGRAVVALVARQILRVMWRRYRDVRVRVALLVCGAILLVRRSRIPLVRLLLKGVILAVLIGGVYVIYLTL